MVVGGAWQGSGRDQVFSYGHVKFAIPMRHASGDVKQRIGYLSLEFWARARIWK